MMRYFVPSARLGVLRFKVLFTAMLVAFVIYALFHWILWPVKITGDSMLPNFHAGERRFINKLAYFSEKPRRGDVVAIQVSNGDIYIKRIIGLPGEELSLSNGLVCINGRLLNEPYVETHVPLKDFAERLGPDSFFVMGDNRAVSVLGPIRSDRILGKIVD